jgi:hypothetical protein
LKRGGDVMRVATDGTAAASITLLLLVLLQSGVDAFIQSTDDFAVESLILSVMFNAAAAVRILVTSSVFRADAAAVNVEGQAATHVTL